MRFENFGESLQEKGVLATSIRNAEIKNLFRCKYGIKDFVRRLNRSRNAAESIGVQILCKIAGTTAAK